MPELIPAARQISAVVVPSSPGAANRGAAAESLDTLATAPTPAGVRLLPPSYPWLQARDRTLVVPDAAQRKALWPTLGRPGALVIDGEAAGSWSARKRGRRLELTVRPFQRLAAGARRQVDERPSTSRSADESG